MSKRAAFIDVRKVIADKNPKLLKRIPGFVIRYLQRILHEEEINAFLDTHHNDGAFEFCRAAIAEFDIKVEARGTEQVPAEGGCILVMNHPLGGMDFIALVTLLEPIRTDIRFIVNDVLMNLQQLQELFIGVNKLGTNARAALREVDEHFAGEELICLFPAGLVSRRRGGQIKDLEWKKTFVTRARKYNKPVLPVHLTGELSNFFYNLANLRAALGIKVNLEMLYLADELFQQRGHKITATFGELIPATTFDDSRSDAEWAQFVKAAVYQLGEAH
jgi:putative hemolysin